MRVYCIYRKRRAICFILKSTARVKASAKTGSVYPILYRNLLRSFMQTHYVTPKLYFIFRFRPFIYVNTFILFSDFRWMFLCVDVRSGSSVGGCPQPDSCVDLQLSLSTSGPLLLRLFGWTATCGTNKHISCNIHTKPQDGSTIRHTRKPEAGDQHHSQWEHVIHHAPTPYLKRERNPEQADRRSREAAHVLVEGRSRQGIHGFQDKCLSTRAYTIHLL